jgi:TonB family protein
MKKLLSLIFILSGIILSAQAPPTLANDSSPIFTYAEKMPQFIGDGGYSGYLKKNLKYPIVEKETGKQGVVYIYFVVEKDGSITNVKEKKGVAGAPGLTKEAIRVISAMPKWKPGEMNGHPVRVEMVQPVKFVIENSPPPHTTKYTNPAFPGGDTALAAYLKKNLVYPKKEKKHHVEGTVVVSFFVEADGTIYHVTAKSEVPGAPGLTEEAIRLVENMPHWIPGTTDDVPVYKEAEVSVVFKL